MKLATTRSQWHILDKFNINCVLDYIFMGIKNPKKFYKNKYI